MECGHGLSYFVLQTSYLTMLNYIEAKPPASARQRGALVLLHAFPVNARMWEPQLAMAERGWRVIAPQFRGFDSAGQVPVRPTPATTMDDYAGDVVDLLDGLHIHDAVVCGLSMGGYVAFAMLRLAARYVQGLVLADTRPQADTPEAAEGRRKMIQQVAEGGAAAIADEMIARLLGDTTRRTRPDVVERVRGLILSNGADAIAGALHAMMTRPDSTDLLASIHIPTLIVAGSEDAVTPPAVAEEMQRKIAGSELAIVESAGHLSNLERSDAFNASLARFLDHRV